MQLLIALFLMSAFTLIKICRTDIASITRNFDIGDRFVGVEGTCNASFCLDHVGYPTSKHPCECGCHHHMPVFLQHVQKCSSKIEGCTLLPLKAVGSGRIITIPSIYDAKRPGLINPGMTISWSSVGIRVNASAPTPPCRINIASYLTASGWEAIKSTSFRINVQPNGFHYIEWLGHNNYENLHLAGKLILLTLSCNSSTHSSLCIAFRILGIDNLIKTATTTSINGFNRGVPQPKPSLSTPSSDSSRQRDSGSDENETDLGLIIGIVCGTLLVITLIGAVVLWTVCWKKQKAKLMRKFYLRNFMQPECYPNPMMRYPNGNAVQETFVPTGLEACQYPVYPPTNPFNGEPWVTAEFHPPPPRANYFRRGHVAVAEPQSNSPPLSRSAIVSESQSNVPDTGPPPQCRRKLYFSPEFFEPDLMERPPPIAEEFLGEVRKMIDFAKNRIRSKRYIPSLLVIPEDDYHSDGKRSRCSSTRSKASSKKAKKEKETTQCSRPNDTVWTGSPSGGSPASSPHQSPRDTAEGLNTSAEESTVKTAETTASAEDSGIDSNGTPTPERGSPSQKVPESVPPKTPPPGSPKPMVPPKPHSLLDTTAWHRTQHSPSAAHKVTSWLCGISAETPTDEVKHESCFPSVERDTAGTLPSHPSAQNASLESPRLPSLAELDENDTNDDNSSSIAKPARRGQTVTDGHQGTPQDVNPFISDDEPMGPDDKAAESATSGRKLLKRFDLKQNGSAFRPSYGSSSNHQGFEMQPYSHSGPYPPNTGQLAQTIPRYGSLPRFYVKSSHPQSPSPDCQPNSSYSDSFPSRTMGLSLQSDNPRGHLSATGSDTSHPFLFAPLSSPTLHSSLENR